MARYAVLTPVLCSLLLVAGCGGSSMSLTEYVDQINAIERTASGQAEALVSGADEADFTPQILQRGLEASAPIREAVQEAADDIEPPDAVADLHDRIFDWHARFMEIEARLAEVAGETPDTDAGWTALSNSDEMAAYRDSLTEGKGICDTFQAELDATEARGAFTDVPWLPSEMSEVVEAVLGCEWFPQDPQTVFLWPPVGTG